MAQEVYVGARLVCLSCWQEGGEDCKHLIAPPDFNFDAQRTEYGKWYRNVYCANGNLERKEAEGRTKYQSFYDWCLTHGCLVLELEDAGEP